MNKDLQKILNNVSPTLKKLVIEKYENYDFSENEEEIKYLKNYIKLHPDRKHKKLREDSTLKINKLEKEKETGNIPAKKILESLAKDLNAETRKISREIADQAISVFEKSKTPTMESFAYISFLNKGFSSIEKKHSSQAMSFYEKFRLDNTKNRDYLLSDAKSLDFLLSAIKNLKKFKQKLDAVIPKSKTKLQLNISLDYQKERLSAANNCIKAVPEFISDIKKDERWSEKDAGDFIKFANLNIKESFVLFKLSMAFLEGNKNKIKDNYYYLSESSKEFEEDPLKRDFADEEPPAIFIFTEGIDGNNAMDFAEDINNGLITFRRPGSRHFFINQE